MENYQELKKTNIDWIGEIPTHWRVTKLKYLSVENVKYGMNISSDNYTDNGVRFIRTTDIDELVQNPVDAAQ
jgi:type I restriction enzyme, S subunit